jgi:ABC-type transport system involved in cytochrome c biogenesis permease subunit
MWNKPYGMKEGFAIGGALVMVGLLLQLGLGPVDWSAYSWPVNGIVLAVFLSVIAMIYQLRKRVAVLQFLGTYKAAIPVLVYAIVLTIIMGLTRQEENGTWLSHMLTFWPFVLVYMLMAVVLGLVVLGRLSHLTSWQRDVPFMLNHLGLFLAMTAATLGNADMQRVKMIAVVGGQEWRALTAEQRIVEMPFTVELKKFIMETYDNGSPKRYASELHIETRSGESVETTVEVNKPADVEGWKIYQYSYDTQMGAMSRTSILELVSDPWLPLVYAGIYMMLAGAVIMALKVICRRLLNATAKARWIYFGIFLFAATFAYFFFSSYNTKTLVPALQSPWFAPHVFVYIFAYSLLAIAAVVAAWKLIDDLVYVSLAFMTIGMLFGALWAKEAWGHYWSWDPKETWALVTWLSYMMYIHLRLLGKGSRKALCAVIIFSFLCLQMCWWGVNYLPTAQDSIHVYNK